MKTGISMEDSTMEEVSGNTFVNVDTAVAMKRSKIKKFSKNKIINTKRKRIITVILGMLLTSIAIALDLLVLF